MFAEAGLYCRAFACVVERCARTVRVDVANLFLVDPRVANRLRHRAGGLLTLRLRGGDVVRVASLRVSGELAKHGCAALTRGSLAFEQQKRRDQIDELRGERMENSFGSQIRNYVLFPYQLVKDVRSGVETGNVDAVLDGDIDQFVVGYHKWRVSQE